MSTYPDPNLPGVAFVDTGLEAELRARLATFSPTYVPRTEHHTSGGVPRFVNRLLLETSPYLLQHAHNPVNWHPWSDAAFARARTEGKAVLLSVGYATCHWCHVMERESFEDLEVAAFINRHFVPIKLDREERPDVDAVYMQAVQAIAGQGGWPMTVVLTPEREPFFAGTYFPARDGERGARVGFLTILRELARLYDSERERVLANAASLTRELRRRAAPAPASGVPAADALATAVRSLAREFDSERGGFGDAPKFPRPAILGLLLRTQRRFDDAAALAMATQTLRAMARGGIYDQVGGGFHRYSTDADWLVPHFEKMLYDNAQLTVAYLEAYQATGDETFANVAREVLAYLEREMTAPAGGFYSATDADSATASGEHAEGYFFTWTEDEVRAALEAPAAELVVRHLGVTPAGNFEGRNVLHVARPLEEVARELGLDVKDARRRLDEARGILYRVRAERPAPLSDDKILVAWNALAITAFARAAWTLGDDAYRERAVRAASFVLEHLRDDAGRLSRSYRAGASRHPGVLDDYAFFIAALLDLAEVDVDPRWLREALALQTVLDAEFWDDEAGGYFAASHRTPGLLTRDKPDYDGAEPSGNSVAAHNLLRLHQLTDAGSFRDRAEAIFRAFGRLLAHALVPLPALLAALDFYLDEPRQVVLALGTRGDAAALAAVLGRAFLPNRVVVQSRPEQSSALADLAPWTEGKTARDGDATVYVCVQGRCELPTRDPRELARLLGASASAPP